MLQIIQVETDERKRYTRELLREYLEWATSMVNHEFGTHFDFEVMLEQDMLGLPKFLPPQGRLLIAQQDDQPAGIIGLRKLDAAIGNVNRVYVRPAFRGQGIGGSLVERSIEEARHMGFSKIRLDSGWFMTAAHVLYRSAGFKEIEPYPESGVPAELHPKWLFMELTL